MTSAIGGTRTAAPNALRAFFTIGPQQSWSRGLSRPIRRRVGAQHQCDAGHVYQSVGPLPSPWVGGNDRPIIGGCEELGRMVGNAVCTIVKALRASATCAS